uniref:Cytochrome b n=1 Tax=Geukensia demissa TaxID=27807 RepID=A0A6B9VPU2_GEUDE|nr:cytochrome b [Geukensia demissa]QHO63837.1 cytochrome b [Geukensia demissa]UJM44205.1 cytochrome b [Geukensia demissa]
MVVAKPFRKRHWLLKVVTGSLYDLPCPINLSVWWSFGSMLGLCLVVQIVSGFMLSLYYVPHSDMAFDSVIYLMRNVHKGWMIRSLHANGASMFFICIYVHICRGLYYGSYLDKGVWNVGVVLYLMLMAEAFLGYVLPWGQMSYWGAVVITSMITVIPYIGSLVVEWLWGGYVVNTRTLTRFYSFHFIIPFLMIVVVMLHFFYLHNKGSNNPLGINSDSMCIPFHPFYTVKDIFGFTCMLWMLMFLVCVKPEMLGNVHNYIPADSMKTPIHIQPEWYFLFAYAILRSIPHKAGGILAMLFSILILLVLPYVHSGKFRSLSFYPVHQLMFWLFICVFIGLTCVGMRPVREPMYTMGQYFTVMYFSLMLLIPFSLFCWDWLISKNLKV